MTVAEKGSFGYLAYKKNQTLIRTLLFLGATILIFLCGLLFFHSNQNWLSIFAAVLCIPTGVSAVNMIMFRKASGCPEEAYRVIEQHRGELLLLYDLYMTSYEQGYPVACATALQSEVLCFLPEDTALAASCDHHIREILSGNGYEGVAVQVLTDLSSFLNALDALEAKRAENGLYPVKEEEQWQPGTKQTIAGILQSISL